MGVFGLDKDGRPPDYSTYYEQNTEAVKEQAYWQGRLNDTLEEYGDEIETLADGPWDRAADAYTKQRKEAEKLQKQMEKVANVFMQLGYSVGSVAGAFGEMAANRRALDELILLKDQAFDAETIKRYDSAIQDLQRSYESLWGSIMANLGAILISVGAQLIGKGNTYAGLALIIIGAGIDIGVAAWQGNQDINVPNYDSSPSHRTVEFGISGQNLAATMDQNEMFRSIAT